MKLGSDLANENVPCQYRFTPKFLDSATLGVAIATVAATALTLLMCHDWKDVRLG
jgi:hypothetical protein